MGELLTSSYSERETVTFLFHYSFLYIFCIHLHKMIMWSVFEMSSTYGLICLTEFCSEVSLCDMGAYIWQLNVRNSYETLLLRGNARLELKRGLRNWRGNIKIEFHFSESNIWSETIEAFCLKKFMHRISTTIFSK